jgi:DNA-binding NarL/FixJ family response regulator
MIRVFLVDDHELVRSGLERLMAETRDIRIKGTAATAGEALRRFGAPAFPYDVVLLDVSLPDGNGLDLIRPLRARAGGAPPVLVLSIHPGEQYALRAIRKGAAGYFAKDGDFESLAGAIRTVAAGRRYLAPEVVERLACEVSGIRPSAPRTGLSDREFEVMRRIAAGQRSKDIADALSVSVKTVATFKARICRKTGLCGTAEIVRYALEHGIEGSRTG